MKSASCRGVLGEVEVAAARFGHPAQEILIESATHAQRGGRGSVLAEARRVADDRLGIGDATVCEAVGQQQAPAEPGGGEALAHLLAAAQPAAAQVRVPPSADPPQHGLRMILRHRRPATRDGTSTTTRSL